MANVELKDLWTCQENLKDRSPRHWADLKVKRNESSSYYDVLIGKKGKNEPHAHQKYDLLGHRLIDEHRGLIIHAKKEVESQLYGKRSTEEMDYNNTKKKTHEMKFRVTIKPGTNESLVSIFEIIDL